MDVFINYGRQLITFPITKLRSIFQICPLHLIPFLSFMKQSSFPHRIDCSRCWLKQAPVVDMSNVTSAYQSLY
ncbi:hypothetical protein BpHYR1_028025 [Brachionus plicatilis]|uniref:Uncharacterized protein n=1 Tax=Brachionus plicatilis TaxID=10195 RepID=A0A3M7QZ11_BRAPC|nr:hypothetical protein BpHYR1_028025 [Brachionus plicatilis]